MSAPISNELALTVLSVDCVQGAQYFREVLQVQLARRDSAIFEAFFL